MLYQGKGKYEGLLWFFFKKTISYLWINYKLLQNWPTSNTQLTILQDLLASNLDTTWLGPLTHIFLTSPHSGCQPMTGCHLWFHGKDERMSKPTPIDRIHFLPGWWPLAIQLFIRAVQRMITTPREVKRGKAGWKPEGGGRLWSGLWIPFLTGNKQCS